MTLPTLGSHMISKSNSLNAKREIISATQIGWLCDVHVSQHSSIQRQISNTTPAPADDLDTTSWARLKLAFQ